MESHHVKPGTIVKQRHDAQPMVILWVEADGEAVRCRWLDGRGWKEASLPIEALEMVAP